MDLLATFNSVACFVSRLEGPFLCFYWGIILLVACLTWTKFKKNPFIIVYNLLKVRPVTTLVIFALPALVPMLRSSTNFGWCQLVN